ncbi:unnamed protein product [Penicillium palitans]
MPLSHHHRTFLTWEPEQAFGLWTLPTQLVAPNIEFIVEDFETEWQYKQNHFDFIHGRCLAGCVADWPRFISRIFDHVKPGGYFESHESAVWAQSDDGSLKEDSALMEWQKAVNYAGEKLDRELNIYNKLKDWVIEAGFEDVKLSVYALPFSPWPRDPHLKTPGKYQAVQLQQAIDSYSLHLYTQVLGWRSEVAKIIMLSLSMSCGIRSCMLMFKRIV